MYFDKQIHVPQLFHNSFYAMGTRCQVILPGIETERAEQVLLNVRQEINRIETCLSRFIPYSELSQINQNAWKSPVLVGEELFGILKTCQHFSNITTGAFDITLRPLLDYWKEKTDNSQADSQLAGIVESSGMRYVTLADADRSVSFSHDSIVLDLGGFGKGYALHMVETQLNSFSIRDAFISFGESSILAKGAHPAGDHWKIGLNDYMSPGRSAYEFALNDGSVSTSSNFFIDHHGKLQNHRHVIKPKTGYPVEELVTVSVKSESAVDAEILSTACLVLSDVELADIRTSLPPCEIVRILYTSGKPDIHIV